MSKLETAIRIAVNAHAGQKDKSGTPYITHPLRLMAAVDGDHAKIVAVLHDVVEDTKVTLEDLRREGFHSDVIDAIECVTHVPKDSYADYVVACKNNLIAKQVKLADLADNYRPDRCLIREKYIDRDLSRLHRYILSYKFLIDELSESAYRSLIEKYGEANSDPS